jgi:hypothetical protein
MAQHTASPGQYCKAAACDTLIMSEALSDTACMSLWMRTVACGLVCHMLGIAAHASQLDVAARTCSYQEYQTKPLSR